ncbi:16S rRNA (adenine(1518)-N(6)/adenine(1519)-N(6))-dimethyltransferase RsmA [Thermogladius sp. 4427co]|uniref:16S rRNA (adenine(1518)-N(6)/adenine(1519)-N(6))- dimethyltransferase RsmA n=1 Tax=Thermogladius sp. 4427co TaxID=3450718 RepID=UPI003F78CEB8
MEKYSRRGVDSSFKNLVRQVLALVKEENIRLKKRLSQHITVYPSVIDWILSSIDPGLETLEIGSGTGIITYYLCRSIARPIIGIEIDEKLAEVSETILDCPNTIVLVGDALELEFDTRQVVSSVPYGISSKLLVKLSRSNSVERAILVLQKEVADRIASPPGTKNYGRLSVLVRLVFEIDPGPVFPSSYFYPRPKVDSRGVVLLRKREYDDLARSVEDFTGKIFTQRRRRVGRVIESVYGVEEREIASLGVETGKRVYELGEEEILRITEYLRSKGLL